MVGRYLDIYDRSHEWWQEDERPLWLLPTGELDFHMWMITQGYSLGVGTRPYERHLVVDRESNGLYVAKPPRSLSIVTQQRLLPQQEEK